MFHVEDELEQLLFWAQLRWSPNHNVSFTSGFHMCLDVKDHYYY
jgi:hypothetical protein